MSLRATDDFYGKNARITYVVRPAFWINTCEVRVNFKHAPNIYKTVPCDSCTSICFSEQKGSYLQNEFSFSCFFVDIRRFLLILWCRYIFLSFVFALMHFMHRLGLREYGNEQTAETRLRMIWSKVSYSISKINEIMDAPQTQRLYSSLPRGEVIKERRERHGLLYCLWVCNFSLRFISYWIWFK